MDTKKKWERTRPACGFRRLAEPKRGGFLLSSPEKEERAGERRPFFISFSPLSSSLPARSSRGEREKRLSVFMPNTIGVPPRGPERGSAFPVRTSTPPGGMPTTKDRRSAVLSGPAEYNTGRREILLPIPAGRMPGSMAGGRHATTQTPSDSPHMTRAPGDPALWP